MIFLHRTPMTFVFTIATLIALAIPGCQWLNSYEAPPSEATKRCIEIAESLGDWERWRRFSQGEGTIQICHVWVDGTLHEFRV